MPSSYPGPEPLYMIFPLPPNSAHLTPSYPSGLCLYVTSEERFPHILFCSHPDLSCMPLTALIKLLLFLSLSGSWLCYSLLHLQYLTRNMHAMKFVVSMHKYMNRWTLAVQTGMHYLSTFLPPMFSDSFPFPLHTLMSRMPSLW